MPKGVYPRSPEHNRKIAEAKRGQPRSPETVRKMADSMKGHTHTAETKAKISAALKGRTPANKGTKRGPLSDETKRKISEANQGHRGAHKGERLSAGQCRKISEGKKQSGYQHSPETREKLRRHRQNRRTGPLTEAHKEKLRAYWNSPAGKARRSRIVRQTLARLSPDEMAQRVAAIREYHGPTRIEVAMQQELQRRGWVFETQYAIDVYYADFYVPHLHLVIECDGDYWHRLPEHQIKDRKRDALMRSRGFRVVRVWEHAIKQDVTAALASALASCQI